MKFFVRFRRNRKSSNIATVLERQRLALRLRFLGFGSLQDGVWISPRDRRR